MPTLKSRPATSIGRDYASKKQSGTLKICIGVITRDRQEMLSQLLDSLARINSDKNRIVLAVVENNSEKTMSGVVECFEEMAPRKQCIYEAEPKMGIPFARNRVLEIALRENCDLVAFIDDDETAGERWLEHLLEEMKTRNLDLVGGPVRLHPVDKKASRIQKVIWEGLVTRNKRVARKAKKKHIAGIDDQVTIITSSWLCKTDFLKKSGLRFNENLGFSGGSDTAFYRAAKAQGAKTGWAPEALVYEFMPLSRLTCRYQFKRAHDQSVVSFRNKHNKVTLKIFTKSLGFMFVKFMSGIGLLFIIPLKRGSSLTIAMRTFGFAAGRASAICGRKSNHYKHTHGN